MKRILLLLLCFSVFACSEKASTLSEEETNKEKIQEITNTIIGRWQFSRLASDPEFKNIIEVEQTECTKGNYTEFFENYSAKDKHCTMGDEPIENNGTFGINLDPTSDVSIVVYLRNINLMFGKSGDGFTGFVYIHKYTQDIFVFQQTSDRYKGKIYFEFKRIPSE